MNGTLVQVTFEGSKPSCWPTAYATADSKPLPLVGSLSENHGSYAGLEVPTVSVPAFLVGRSPGLHEAGFAVVEEPDEPAELPSSFGAQATDARSRGTLIRTRGVRRMGRS